MSDITNSPSSPAVADPQAAAGPVTSEEFSAQLQALMALAPDTPALTPGARRALQRYGRVSESEAQAAINVVRSSPKVAGTVEETEEIQQVLQEANRWTRVENELKAAWKMVADANLVRWNRIATFTAQTYGIGSQLARVPENADLLPHVQEVKRLRRSHHRRKTAGAASEPASPESESLTEDA